LPAAAKQTRAGKSLMEFRKLILNFRGKAETNNAYDTAVFIGRMTGIMDQLRADNSIEGITRTENLNALFDGIKEFVEEDEAAVSIDTVDKSLTSYLQNIALLTDLDTEDGSQDYISLMSAHSAKGLEFKAVFVVGLEENLFPSYLSMGSPEEVEEERRLFYVAITRAKQYLTLSYAASRYQYGQIRFNDPSRFLEEIAEELFESTVGIKKAKPELPQPKVLGGLKRLNNFTPKVDPSGFEPSPSSSIAEGMEVMHLKFGKGRVMKIDGARENKVATIQFEEIDNPQRRIMLRFAKLQILN
jgi:DNA helicase-2/ATP-dependent DNA helicase PcrA